MSCSPWLSSGDSRGSWRGPREQRPRARRALPRLSFLICKTGRATAAIAQGYHGDKMQPRWSTACAEKSARSVHPDPTKKNDWEPLRKKKSTFGHEIDASDNMEMKEATEGRRKGGRGENNFFKKSGLQTFKQSRHLPERNHLVQSKEKASRLQFPNWVPRYPWSSTGNCIVG